jgi:predicted enzyme related to lactoylglutathione lyase
VRPNEEAPAGLLVRDGYPPGVPCWVDTAQPDPDAAEGFYGDLFGWRFAGRMPAGAPGRYVVARRWDHGVAGIGSDPDGGPTTPTWDTYVSVASADETAARVREAGGAVLAAPLDVLDDGRMAVCADPAGARFRLWEPRGFAGAQVVNVAGSWNWSTLSTDDPDRAIAFYGAVFGWEATTLDLGQGEVVMWRVPGYAEFLERLQPDLRRRHAEGGVPAGFSDAIAWMTPAAGELARWDVTFAVDDADATARRAAELGGRVVRPPVTAGVTRVAVLRDPQGAVFTVSRYQPG